MLLYVVEPRSSVVSHPTDIKTDKFGVSTAKSLPQVRFKIHKTMQCQVRDRPGATINILVTILLYYEFMNTETH